MIMVTDIRRRHGSGNQMHCFRDDHMVSREILLARERAHLKHGANSIEAIPADDPRWLSILVEELGEVAHELTYDSGGSPQTVRRELIDLAAVATAWIEAIDQEAESQQVERSSARGGVEL
jgi:hypothetical protein